MQYAIKRNQFHPYFPKRIYMAHIYWTLTPTGNLQKKLTIVWHFMAKIYGITTEHTHNNNTIYNQTDTSNTFSQHIAYRFK